MELRPHQTRTLLGLRQSLGKGNRGVMVQLPTGAGKTIIAAEIVKLARGKGNRVCFVVPSLSLIKQTCERFFSYGIDATEISIIQSDHPETDYSKPIQVASRDTLARRRLPNVDLVIIDEAHQWHKCYAKWFDAPISSHIPFVGLSATPWRQGLGNYYSDLIIGSTIQELTDQGYLSPFRVFAPSKPDLQKVKVTAGDYNGKQLAEVMNRKTLIGDQVQNWLANGQNRPTIAFCVDRAHAQAMQSEFVKAGVNCGYVDSYTDLDERQSIADKFHSGDYSVVTSVGCLTTGVDWDVRCIILARPTNSKMLFVQMIGRGLRTAEGKDYCLIFDHSDTHQRLGFVTDININHLDTGEQGESKRVTAIQEKKPSECPSCKFMRPVGVHICPECSFAPTRQSNIETVEATLEEINRSIKKANRVTTREEKQQFYSELCGYETQKNYKYGWAANQYRGKFGVWPNDYQPEPLAPTQSTLNWIRSRQIAYAKRTRKYAA